MVAQKQALQEGVWVFANLFAPTPNGILEYKKEGNFIKKVFQVKHLVIQKNINHIIEIKKDFADQYYRGRKQKIINRAMERAGKIKVAKIITTTITIKVYFIDCIS